MTSKDKALGMDRSIDRRDFLNGVAVTAGALAGGGLFGGSAAFAAAAWPQDEPAYYPPTLTGMRGSHPGSFENAHKLRDGDFWSGEGAPRDTGEVYDLIIVGGGISGLSAAHFYRAARPDARVLIIDNHDDFGGHAKRNEYLLDGKLHLLNGGTLMIDSPFPYSAVAGGLLTTLGVDPVALSRDCDHPKIYSSLGMRHGVFFDKETFGTASRLVAGGAGVLVRARAAPRPDFLNDAPVCKKRCATTSCASKLARSTTCPAFRTLRRKIASRGSAMATIWSRSPRPTPASSRSIRAIPRASGASASTRSRPWTAGRSSCPASEA